MACEFSVSLPGSLRNAFEIGCAALDEVDRLERRLTVYDDESDVAALNRRAAERPVPLDEELADLLRTAARLHAQTDGCFDAASGALVRVWGFLRGPKHVPSREERAAALAVSGWRHVRLDDAGLAFDRPGVELNLGAIGKGFAIDRALDLLRTHHGITAALMQGGRSSLKAIGEPAGGWVVAIGDPRRPGETAARVRLHDDALGTSGADNQFFEADGRRFGHILDPRCGWPAEGVLSASVVAPSAAEADALSTAFFVMGLDGTRRFCGEHPEIGAVLVLPDEIVVLGPADVEVTS
jgi:thiamine biosynthesis lipoprotein